MATFFHVDFGGVDLVGGEEAVGLGAGEGHFGAEVEGWWWWWCGVGVIGGGWWWWWGGDEFGVIFSDNLGANLVTDHTGDGFVEVAQVGGGVVVEAEGVEGEPMVGPFVGDGGDEPVDVGGFSEHGGVSADATDAGDIGGAAELLGDGCFDGDGGGGVDGGMEGDVVNLFDAFAGRDDEELGEGGESELDGRPGGATDGEAFLDKDIGDLFLEDAFDDGLPYFHLLVELLVGGALGGGDLLGIGDIGVGEDGVYFGIELLGLAEPVEIGEDKGRAVGV